MRALFIVGNWKMNPLTAAEAVALAEAVKAGFDQFSDVRVAVYPPSIFLHAVDKALDGSPVGLGGQNMHWKPKGAFTGELCGAMLKDAGCTHVILGHSERRHGLNETDAQVNSKLHAALEVGLMPIVCVGETGQERDAGQTEDVVQGQLVGSLAGLSPEQMAGTTLAYEPVWAIGTGVNATPTQAEAVHTFIRSWLSSTFGPATAARVVVQYGGSVKVTNARELLSCPDIDGALVGGDSLVAANFLGILAEAQEASTSKKTV